MEWRVVVECDLNEQDLFRRRNVAVYMIRMQEIADKYHFGEWPKPGEQLPMWQGTEEQREQFETEVDEWITEVLLDLKFCRDEEVEMSF